LDAVGSRRALAGCARVNSRIGKRITKTPRYPTIPGFYFGAEIPTKALSLPRSGHYATLTPKPAIPFIRRSDCFANTTFVPHNHPANHNRSFPRRPGKSKPPRQYVLTHQGQSQNVKSKDSRCAGNDEAGNPRGVSCG